MDSSRWQAIRNVYHAALDRTGKDRAAFLERACEGKDSLRLEIESLLARGERAGSFLELPSSLDTAAEAKSASAGGDTLTTGMKSAGELVGAPAGGDRVRGNARRPRPKRPRRPGTRIGTHTTFANWAGADRRRLRAQQQQPYRPVALKVSRGGRYVDEQQVRLFQREAQALARLRHPCIGAIYEAGRTEDGQHFFAMELVRGRSLMEYVRQTHLSTRQRLELFRKICDAIHYAHQKGVRSRPQAEQHRLRLRWHPEDSGLRPRQDHRCRYRGDDSPDGDRSDRRNAPVHEPRAGPGQRGRDRYSQRRLFAGCDPL